VLDGLNRLAGSMHPRPRETKTAPARKQLVSAMLPLSRCATVVVGPYHEGVAFEGTLRQRY
jgi:hypothetical protein